MPIWPEGRDTFRQFVSLADDLVAQDLNDMFDMAVAVETELGVEPSGRMGTVLGRLFAKGNLSKIDGGWRRIEARLEGGLNGFQFDEQGIHKIFGFSTNRWFGTETEHGEGRPAFFAALQGPLISSLDTGYGGVPWNLHIFGEVKDDRVFLWGRDVQAQSGPTVGKRRLTSPNSTSGIEIAMLAWGLIP